jgi:hypothetical protein
MAWGEPSPPGFPSRHVIRMLRQDCWRCGTNAVELVDDPLCPGDHIRVCVDCAYPRRIVAADYANRRRRGL